MSIPGFEPTGLLPAGSHECTLQEMVDRLAFTPERLTLCHKFREALFRLPPLDAVTAIIVDGSFAEDKPVPKDVDALLVVTEMQDGGRGSLLLQWVQFRRKQIKAELAIDLFVDDEEGVREAWRGRWMKTRDGSPKGWLRVTSGWR